jgi:hypothetical protein
MALTLKRETITHEGSSECEFMQKTNTRHLVAKAKSLACGVVVICLQIPTSQHSDSNMQLTTSACRQQSGPPTTTVLDDLINSRPSFT